MRQKKISEGLKRYYRSIDFKKRKQETLNVRMKNTLEVLTETPQSTVEIAKKYSVKIGKDITLRRMSQIMYEMLGKQLVNTKFRENQQGRSRVWSLRQKRF